MKLQVQKLTKEEYKKNYDKYKKTANGKLQINDRQKTLFLMLFTNKKPPARRQEVGIKDFKSILYSMTSFLEAMPLAVVTFRT